MMYCFIILFLAINLACSKLILSLTILLLINRTLTKILSDNSALAGYDKINSKKVIVSILKSSSLGFLLEPE